MGKLKRMKRPRAGAPMTWSDDEVGNLVCAVLTVREAGLVGRILDVVSHGESVDGGMSALTGQFRQHRQQLGIQRLLGIPDAEDWWHAVKRGYSGDAKARATLKAMAHEVLMTAMAEPRAAAKRALAADGGAR